MGRGCIQKGSVDSSHGLPQCSRRAPPLLVIFLFWGLHSFPRFSFPTLRSLHIVKCVLQRRSRSRIWIRIWIGRLTAHMPSEKYVPECAYFAAWLNAPNTPCNQHVHCKSIQLFIPTNTSYLLFVHLHSHNLLLIWLPSIHSTLWTPLDCHFNLIKDVFQLSLLKNVLPKFLRLFLFYF